MTTGQVLKLLRKFESQNVTFIDPDGRWPIVWERARGVHVWDADGKKYLDLTAAFGVAAAGHANTRVVKAGQTQMERLLHAMGDVHPHELKARLARELSRITFERWGHKQFKVQNPKSKEAGQELSGGRPGYGVPALAGGAHKNATVPKVCRAFGSITRPAKAATQFQAKTIFCNSGFEAVEAALKTAILATKKRGVIAFEGAYHGLGYGALNATYRKHFTQFFRKQLSGFAHFVPFPIEEGTVASVEAQICSLLRKEEVGAILVEPIQARGGINIPPKQFLPMLRQICDENGALLVLDEIYTGFGRTGEWFACEHSTVTPDIICLGKALTGGFPLSACVGRAVLMDAAWPVSTGEAIHTSTFLGHPVGCAMALAQIEEVRRLKLVECSASLGRFLLDLLESEISNLKLQISFRGMGLLLGMELRRHERAPATEETLGLIKSLLHAGFILLPEGEHSNVISFTPPLTISEAQLKTTMSALQEALSALK